MVKPDASLWKRRGYGFSRVDLPECVLHACPKISGYVCSQTSGLVALKLGPLPVHLDGLSEADDLSQSKLPDHRRMTVRAERSSVDAGWPESD